MNTTISSIDNINSALCGLKEKIDQNKRKNYYLSEHHADILFKDLHYNIKQELKNLFGNVNEKGNYGCFTNIFSSSIPAYDKGAMFSYWSYQGVPYNSSKEDDGEWRDNFFYKGSRYSDENLKANFYKPFNVISDYCKSKDGSNVPIDFFVRHAKEAKRNNSNLHISPIIFIPKTKSCNNPSAINLPVKVSFESENYFKDDFKKLLIGLEEKKAEKDRCNTEIERLAVANSVKQLLEANLENAFNQLKTESNTLVHQLVNELSIKFPHINPKDDSCLYDVFCLVVCFQFYDQEGITYLFLPNNINESHCCLGLLIPFSNESKIANQSKDLINLVNILSPLPILEKEVFEIVKKNIILKHVWKAHYLTKAPLYESLCSHICVLLKYICRQKKIKVLDIAFRVKDFDSFYNRAVDRYNDPKKFKIEDDELKKYREGFISGSSESAKVVFSKFLDLSGVRILCVFKDDLDEIKKFLLDDCEINDLDNLKKPHINEEYGLEINFFDKKSPNDYRAEHFILKLGDERKKLIELKELSDFLCELQVKTVLSQGWSDADHDLFYKSNIPTSKLCEILPENNKEIGEKRGLTSRKLDEIDEQFVEFKNRVKTIIDDI